MKNKNESNNNKTVTIGKGTKPYNIRVTSKSSFFNEPIVYSIEHGCLLLRHATIDDEENKVVPNKSKRTLCSYPCKNQTIYTFYVNTGGLEIDFKQY